LSPQGGVSFNGRDKRLVYGIFLIGHAWLPGGRVISNNRTGYFVRNNPSLRGATAFAGIDQRSHQS
jgi:hypothetical protein